jgi:outer membrane immunogenic protein
MKKLLLATVALVALGATVPALAADLSARAPAYTNAPVYAAPIYNWTGFYIGGHLGGAFGGDNSLTGTDGRFLGGIQGGADYEFGNNWVIGAEAQYSWLGSNNTGLLFPSGTVVTSNSDQLGSVTGRLGYSFGPTLLYAKGGYAWKDADNISVVSAGGPAAFTTDSNRKDGYTVGGGLEYMFAPNWSAKIEYQYYNFGSGTFLTGPSDIVGARFTDSENTVKAGLNYRFNWANSARY